MAQLSCETDDIEPNIIVSLSVNSVNIFEDNGTATLTASLNAAAPAAVEATLFLSGTAQGNGTDYTISATTITIPVGATIGSVTISTVQDTDQEGDESIDVRISAASNAEISPTDNQVSINLEDDDVTATAQFILNEVLYDPSNSGLAGDANGDGVYGQDEDSFLEFYNPSSRDFDMVGYEIWDSTLANPPTIPTASSAKLYTFPASSTINAGKALVVFGGGTPTGAFGGATVLNAATGLNFNNDGEYILIKAPNGSNYLIFDSDALSNNPNESYTRNPDITGGFEQHSDNTPLLFSPGTKIDGTAF